MFAFIAKHRSIWPPNWMCDALGVSRIGYHAWFNRPPSQRSRTNDVTTGYFGIRVGAPMNGRMSCFPSAGTGQ